MSSTADTRLIWIDLEMTGLDTDNDQIIEVATIVTDDNLNILGLCLLYISQTVC